MPRRCCVPGCKGNYASTLKSMGAISTFQIPKTKELRKKWLDAIPRKNWIPSQSSSVCRLHFKNEDIVNPSELDFQRLKLKVDAVPSIFKSFSMQIKDSTAEIFKKKKENDDIIEDFSHLVNMYPRKIQVCEDWHSKLVDNILHFFILDITADDINIKNQISIFDDLRLSVSMNSVEINISELQCFKTCPDVKLRQWSQLQFLLKVLSEELQTRKMIYFEDTKFMIEI